MKQVVYTCERCGKQEAVDADKDKVNGYGAPIEWAAIHYARFRIVQEDDKPGQVERTIAATHACDDCAQSVLDFIESKSENARS